MDEPTNDQSAAANRVRRRVVSSDTDAADREGRSGCLLIGAVLGIVLGALFAFFGLPPLINHFFAEEQVPLGQAYSSGGRIIKAVSVQQAATGTVVILEMTVNSPWTPKPANFTLEYDSGGSWAKATSVVNASIPADPPPPLVFDASNLGKVTQVWVTFPYEPDRGTARYIHLGDPHIRLEMLQVATP